MLGRARRRGKSLAAARIVIQPCRRSSGARSTRRCFRGHANRGSRKRAKLDLVRMLVSCVLDLARAWCNAPGLARAPGGFPRFDASGIAFRAPSVRLSCDCARDVWGAGRCARGGRRGLQTRHSVGRAGEAERYSCRRQVLTGQSLDFPGAGGVVACPSRALGFPAGRQG